MKENFPDSKEFWADRRVCVTGGAGFLGSFVQELIRAEQNPTQPKQTSAQRQLLEELLDSNLLRDFDGNIKLVPVNGQF